MEVVRDEQNGRALVVLFAHEVENAFNDRGAQSRGCFIEDKKPWFIHYRLGDLDLLAPQKREIGHSRRSEHRSKGGFTGRGRNSPVLTPKCSRSNTVHLRRYPFGDVTHFTEPDHQSCHFQWSSK